MNSLPQRSTDFELTTSQDGFALSWQQRLILRHSAENPCLWIGAGVADIDMFRGNFSIKDKLNEKIALTEATVSELPDGWLVQFSRGATIRPPFASPPMRRDACSWICKTTTCTITVSGYASQLIQTTISTAAANSSLISICAASRSRCGPANRALAVIKPAMSPGRQTVKRTPAATITGPSSRNRPLSARRSITATSIIAAI